MHSLLAPYRALGTCSSLAPRLSEKSLAASLPAKFKTGSYGGPGRSQRSVCKRPHSLIWRCWRTKPLALRKGSGGVSSCAGKWVAQRKKRYITRCISQARNLVGPDAGIRKSASSHFAPGRAAPASFETRASTWLAVKQSRKKCVTRRSKAPAGGAHSNASVWTNLTPAPSNPSRSSRRRANASIRALASTQVIFEWSACLRNAARNRPLPSPRMRACRAWCVREINRVRQR
jgi:hypothetical protein